MWVFIPGPVFSRLPHGVSHRVSELEANRVLDLDF
jgi:hypothetical protein